MNPFEHDCKRREALLMDWRMLWPKPYDKCAVDPYTRTRVILMNGTEFENVWFSHQFSRNTEDNALRRQLALLRRSEQQQQKLISALKPPDETVLEHTIGYEQLAVDLTAHLGGRVSNPNLKNALDFALLEDFDHLYRYADLMEMHSGMHAETLVGGYTEIMPGRPTIAEHRHPLEAVNKPICGKEAALLTRLQVGIITAAEQQTMNFYMNIGNTYAEEWGRKLYQEIAMIEEQHVSEYGSLKDPEMTPAQCLLMHDYTASYLYYSCMKEESDPAVRHIWEQGFEQTVAQLHRSAALLEKTEGMHWQQVIAEGSYPQLLTLGANIDYVRGILGATVHNTKKREGYADVRSLPDDADFFRYQRAVNPDVNIVPSHMVIREIIRKNGEDYRYETADHPVPELCSRKMDNVSIGRK